MHKGAYDHNWLPVLLAIFVAACSTDGTASSTETACEPLAEDLPDIVADDPERMTAEPDDEQAFLYDDDTLRTYDLQLSEADLASIDADPVAEQYVPGTLMFQGQEYGPVGIRYKGSLGAWIGCTANSPPGSPVETIFNVGGRKICPKLSLKVSFNEYDDEGRFFGVKKLVFHAMNLDASMMRERLGYQLFRQMGVPSPRTVHALVRINGELAGVFLNVEHIDGRFTRSRFADGAGNLYKEVWPTASSTQTPPSEARFINGLRTNRDERPSVDKLLRFGEHAMAEAPGVRARAVAEWLNMESTMGFIAVDRTIRADDGPFHFWCSSSGCDNHNFFIYEEAYADRVWLVPWDLDTSFIVSEKGTVADRFLTVVQEWNNASAACGAQPSLSNFSRQMAPACDPLFRTLGCNYHPNYQRSVARLLDGPFSAERVARDVDEWVAQIEDAVADAHMQNELQLSPEAWQVGLADFKDRVDILRNRARDAIE